MASHNSCSAAVLITTMTAAVIIIATFVSPAGASDASVDIVNHVGQGDPIQVHCHSRDTDVGLQTLVPNETWGFGFKINFFGSTLFSCSFVSSNTGSQSASFETFGDEVRTKVPCVHCVWTVRPEGFYVNIQGNPGVGTFFHPWGTHTVEALPIAKPQS